MKKNKKEYNEEKETSQIIWMIFIVPIAFFILDLANLGHICFPYIDNLTEKYDWLSFIGTYAGTIVSAIFLLFITKMDRRDNNEILRQSQRPYLDVNWTILSSEFINQNTNNLNRHIFIYNNFGLDGYDNSKEYLTLEIRNTGASTAIIDVNKSNFTLVYNKCTGLIESEEIIEKQIEKIHLNKVVKRKSISAGESMFIVCNSTDVYNVKKESVSKDTYIRNTEIYYKDLFNYKYEDICEYINREIIPEKDNELIHINK